MATTPNYGWVTPTPQNYVVDLPADFETFADAVDATVKNIDNVVDATELRLDDLEVITTQGDLIVGDSGGDPSRLALGSNGQFLSSNGTTALWSNVPASIPPSLTPTGLSYWVKPPHASADGTSLAATEDVTYYVPVYLPTCTIDRIAISTRSTPTPTSGNTTRLGIYANSSANLPGNLIIDAGTVNPAAVNTSYEITISQAITSGWHWLAMNRQVTSGTAPNYRAAEASAYLPAMSFLTSSGDGSLPTAKGYTQTGVTGAFANATSLSLLTGISPTIFVRIA